MARIAVIYYSATGNVCEAARYLGWRLADFPDRLAPVAQEPAAAF